jgi:LuxR family transcriptional regulator, maltose regulon positive regulatory protein
MPSARPSALSSRVPRPLRGELPRSSLLAQLESFEGQLLVLVAPGGYGKTTLLAQHARRREGQVVWLSLGDEDADPRRLGQRLVEAVQVLIPGLPCPEWQRRAAQDTAAEGLAHALATDLGASLLNLDFVLDAAERLSGAAEQWLVCWLDALPEGHRVILAGRAEPGIGLSRRVAAGQAQLIGVDELAFSPDETARCLAGATLPATPDTVHAQLEGWPVGVALVRAGAAPQLTPALLIQEVLDRLPPALAQALPGASVLDVWTEAVAARHALALPPGWLLAVRRAGLPLSPLGAGTYRPHQLLREVLDEALRRDLGRYRALHLQAGEQAEESGDPLRALRHYLVAGALERAVTVVSLLTDGYENRCEYRLARQVLELFPVDRLPPDLQRLLGHALLETGEAARGERLLYELRQAGYRAPALLRSLAVLASRADRPEEFLTLVQEGLTLTETGWSSPDQMVAVREQRRLLVLKAWALHQAGRNSEAWPAAQTVAALAEQAGDLIDFGAAQTVLAYTYSQLGRTGEQETALMTALECYGRLGLSQRQLILQNDLASLLNDQGRPAEALMILEAALPLAEQEGGTDLALLLETWGDVLLWQGAGEAALTSYQRALQVCQQANNHLLALRVMTRCAEAAAQADRPDEVQRAVAGLQAAARATRPHAQFLATWCAGLWARRQRDWVTAARHFSCAQMAPLLPDCGFHWRVLLYLMEARTELNDVFRRQASDWDRLMAPAQSHHFLTADYMVLSALASRFRCQQWPTATLDRLLAQRRLPLAADRQSSQAPLLLEVFTLGVPRVALNGLPLHVPLSKSMELLAWLAINREGRRDQLIGALWNDSNERRCVEYFKVAVRHLRKALASHPEVGSQPLIYQDGVYRLSERLTVRVDALTIRSALANPTTELLRQAVASHIGPFLPTAESDWAQAVRLDTLEQTVTAALTLGARLELIDSAEAAAAYERAAELDPLHEASYLRLIEFHRGRNDDAAAQHAYIRYRRMLNDEWGETPGEDLTHQYGPGRSLLS